MKCCQSCNKDITKDNRYGGYCQSCYKYFRDGGTVNPLPPKGVITKDERGYVVCHICGKAYKRLGSHIKESHSMCIAEYKERFELCNNAKTTEANYSEHMHELAYKYNMPERLKQVGQATRIKKGERDKRLGKKVRLQECIERSKRNIKKEIEGVATNETLCSTV
jgi:hypothetical protein